MHGHRARARMRAAVAMQRSSSDEAAGTIELGPSYEFAVVPADPKTRRPPTEEHQFQITRPGRTYILCAPNLAVCAPSACTPGPRHGGVL